jgi:predicted RNA-binding Zn-ribbon protein involved in translation (DUF1610 family)
MAKADWHLANFTDEFKRLGKLIASGEVYIPTSIELSPGQRTLLWSNAGRLGTTVEPEKAMLDEFVALCELRPPAIVQFAKRWGVLYLDCAGRPCQPGVAAQKESVEAWMYYSRRARAVLNIGASLSCGKLGSLDDWAALRGTASRAAGFVEEICEYSFFTPRVFRREYPFDSKNFDHPDYVRTIEQDWYVLSFELYIWLKLARVGFIAWPAGGHGCVIQLDFNGCFLSFIALQLALTVADTDSLFTCSGCGVPYARTKKRPKRGNANFCPKCGREEAVRQAGERLREKQAKARALKSGGVSLTDIAKRLDTKPATLRRWLTRKDKHNEKTTRK